MPKPNKNKTESKPDICYRRAPDGRIVCGHARKNHKFAKQGELHQDYKLLAKAGADGGMYETKNLNGFCNEPLCSCTAFVDSSGNEFQFKEINPFAITTGKKRATKLPKQSKT
jgi:hypothetical protein